MYKEKNNILVGAIMYVFMFLFHIDLLMDNCKQSEKVFKDFLLIGLLVISIIADLIAAYFLYKNKRQNGLGVSLWMIQSMLISNAQSKINIGTEWPSYVLDIFCIFIIIIIIMFFKTQKTVFKVLPTIVMCIGLILMCIGSIVLTIEDTELVTEFVHDALPFVVLIIITLIQINQSFEKDLNYIPGVTELLNADNNDLLLEYEELLDMGAITPAEFEEKKKELLR